MNDEAIMFRKLTKKLYYHLPRPLRNYILFIYRVGYWPNFKNPKTYNEKIGYRKRNWDNELFITCSDKIAVREYVAAVVGDKYLIESVYADKGKVSEELLTSIVAKHGNVLVKANHNSGPVQFLYAESSSETVRKVSEEINRQLTHDYGGPKMEGWYSHISRGVIIEKNISITGYDLPDYRFHVFNNIDGSQPKIIVNMDMDRELNHHRAVFDEEFNRLPFSWRVPDSQHALLKPKNYDTMLAIAKDLAKPFSYVRVDLFNVNGRIYFGEMTFAHESGHGRFTPRSRDRWLGDLWTMDPAQ
ncbi:ATP-grasp fold amidoligase family protein [Halomonas piscis]|uniref:ATP-grasp fold amidoligase family protein n=1 Tax=Halomonas piscis TaxID=3031727 RepID=UPI0028A0338A|nr:ATP-grasp fold amidoligase family protein [Halomonas piscis]